MTKLEIFDDIVSIMEKDSATCKDKGAGDFQKYRANISDSMSEDEFALTVRRYLASFQVPAHLALYSTSSFPLPFSLRRIGDALYVTDADAGCGFAKGDKIIVLGNLSVPAAAEAYAEFLYGEPIERQCFWNAIFHLFPEVTVERPDGIRETVPLVLTEHRDPKCKYEFTRLSPSTVMLRFDDFAEDKPIHALINEHEQDILSADSLIIDVRNNAGGSDSAFYPLLDFCFDAGEVLRPADDAQEFNYTERNVDLRLAAIERMAADLSPDSLLGRAIAHMKAHRGDGFVLDEFSEDSFDIKGSPSPAHVYILSDCNCGSSGDAFVELARAAKKVTVVGRPTMGILDYSNEAVMMYGNYAFMYPTSRRTALDRGIAMGGRGVPVDVYVPFTEEHLRRDVDIEKVLELITQTSAAV